MATGAWPVDDSTPVGLFRTEIGDDQPTVTPVGNSAEFEFLSDVAIQAMIDRNPDDYSLAMSSALDTMSRHLIIAAQDIQVDDIRIRTVEKARLFAEHAASLRNSALFGGASSAFTVVPLTGTQDASTYARPQGTPYPMGF